MSILHKTARQSFRLFKANPPASAAMLIPLWTRAFSNTTTSYKKDILKSAPGWKSENATESEADIKAEREPLPGNLEELQKESVKVIKENTATTHKVTGKVIKKKTKNVDDHVDEDRGA